MPWKRKPPRQLEVAASYGLSIRKGDVLAQRMAQFILSPAARVVFERYGFGGP
jgi:hypothetical protein